MHFQSLRLDNNPTVYNVNSLANDQIQPSRFLVYSKLPLAQGCLSIQTGDRDSFQWGSSVASTHLGQNSTPSLSRNNSRIADITQCIPSSLAATLQRILSTSTATPGSSSCSLPVPGNSTATYSMCQTVSSSASDIACTPTPLSGLDNLPNPIPNPEVHTIITKALWTRATHRNARWWQWQLQPSAVSTPQFLATGSCSIHLFGKPTLTRHVFQTSRLVELYKCNRWPFRSACDLEMVSYATPRNEKAFA